MATVWSPQRVRVSRIVITTITPSAQYTVTYGEPPKNRKNVSPPGVSTGNAPEMFSVSPLRSVGHPERGDERGDTDDDGDQPVDESDERSPRERPTITASQIGRPQSVTREVEDPGREREDHADGEVDLAADQEHHLAGGDDRDRRRELSDHACVVRRRRTHPCASEK